MLLKHHVRTHRATNGICVKQGERLLEMGHVSIEQRLGEDEGHRALAGQILSQPKQLSQLAAASRLEKYLGPRNISILEITFQFLLMVRKFPPPAPPPPLAGPTPRSSHSASFFVTPPSLKGWW